MDELNMQSNNANLENHRIETNSTQPSDKPHVARKGNSQMILTNFLKRAIKFEFNAMGFWPIKTIFALPAFSYRIKGRIKKKKTNLRRKKIDIRFGADLFQTP